jgi:four helix bundle protein
VPTFRKFEEIEAWKKARDLTRKIYRHTRAGALARDFALRDQIRRAAVSVMSNIAEGFERDGRKEFLQFLSIAKGSIGELKSQLYVVADQEHLPQNELQSLMQMATETGALIAGLMNYLRKVETPGAKYKPREPHDASEPNN